MGLKYSADDDALIKNFKNINRHLWKGLLRPITRKHIQPRFSFIEKGLTGKYNKLTVSCNFNI